MTSPTFLLLMLLLIIIIFTPQICNAAPKKFTALLVFGDSTVDSGNNNHILTIFRGNHAPYGRAFPGSLPTGRLSDGKLVTDFLSSMIGLKETVPPFLDPTLSDKDIVTGVSFASAGSGYDDLTSAVSLVIPVSKQTAYFREYIQRLNRAVGEKESRKIVAGALVLVSAGTNDLIFNFYLVPSRKFQFTMDQYQNFLLNRLTNILKELYSLGCRKIMVAGLPPIGCLPIQMTLKSPPFVRNCIDSEDQESRSYNDKLQKLLPLIQNDLPGTKILYIDVYNPIITIINNPQKYGFVETKRGCCGSGLVELGPLCNEFTILCQNASQYIFFDSIHPTESTYRIVSKGVAELALKHL